MLNHKPLILKNYMVNTLVELLGIPLSAQTARARNRFVLLFNDTANAIEAERQALLKEYGDLDEKGELQVGTNGRFKLKDEEGFAKAYEEMTQRTLAVPCNANQYTDFVQMKHVLDTLETRLTVAQTTIYDEIMTAFEEWAGKPPVEAGTEGEEEGATA